MYLVVIALTIVGIALAMRFQQPDQLEKVRIPVEEKVRRTKKG